MLLCPKCGENNPLRGNFCHACGATLAPSGSGWDLRKTVTVLFCDVVGSTEIGERLDPESVRRVMSRYFDEMRRILEHHGATVEKFIGDAVMAAFGVPRVHEDDAVRAVRAAAEMRDRLRVLNEELDRKWGVTILARIGVNTGEVLAGNPSAGESFVTGDTVNVAARLEQAASPMDVLIGEPTHRLVLDAVISEPVEALALKGKAEPVRAYRVIDVLPWTSGHARRFDSPMVGRWAEMAELDAAIIQTRAQGSSHLVSVLGAAGVGKTRLVEEFLGEVGNTAAILRGRCLPYGEGITYWPLLELVRQAAAIGETDPPGRARAKIDAFLGSADDGTDVAEQIARIMGLETEAPPQQIFWAARRFLETIAALRPLIVVLDDLQWAEPTFLDLIQYLTDRTRESPILFLCMARPELLRTRPGWAGIDPHVTSIILDPLGDDESDRLVENLLGAGLSKDERHRIVEAAEGNPLFVEEMLRMLIEQGHLRRSQSGWEAAEDLSRVPVPPTVQAILAARLDALDPAERAVIERAAVIGEIFYWGAVADISPDAVRSEVGTHLMTLERRQLIKPASSDLEREDAYRFRHLLVRDTAYREIPKSARAEIHESFADWLERSVGERLGEYREIVAYHLEQAHRCLEELGPLDEHGHDVASRAADHLAAAGVRAWDRGDEPAVENLLNRSLQLLPPQDARRVEVLLTLADPAYWMGLLAKEGMAEEALAIGRATGDPVLVARAEPVFLFQRLYAHPGTVQPDEVAAAIDRAIPILESAADARFVTSEQLLRGILEGGRGKLSASSSWYALALETARSAGISRVEAQAAGGLGDVLLCGPTPADEAIARLRESLDEVRGNRLAEVELGLRLGTLLFRSGMRAEGTATMERARAEAEDLGYRTGMLLVDYFLSASVWLWDGDLEACERGLRRLSEEEADDIGFLCTIFADLAIILCASARYDEAETLARRSLEITAPGDLHPAVTSRAALARCAAHLRSPEEGLHIAREAIEFTEGLDWPDLRVTALRALAETQHVNGDREQAVRALQECVALYEAKGFGPSAERIRFELADMTAHPPGTLVA